MHQLVKEVLHDFVTLPFWEDIDFRLNRLALLGASGWLTRLVNQCFSNRKENFIL